ncbi:MAG: MgtC/SapB family protein [Cypionkella sp.]
MPIPLIAASANMAVALACGALIGSERQVRQRMAGLRTNALVALGAAAFVVFSQLVEHDASPTRVAAQVVSGIGFLGAGIIFREGFNVHGLNTAATLWCSAAVGVLSGIGAWPYAVVLTGLVVFVNLGLRPLVKLLKRKTKAGIPVQRLSRVVLTCDPAQEAGMRSLLLRCLASEHLHLQEISTERSGEALEITALVSGEDLAESQLEPVVGRIGLEAHVQRIRWYAAEDV